MALVDLKTNLKSLKYGDYPAIDNKQPYIQVDINRPGTNLIGRYDDGLVRGGAAGAIKSSLVDTLRIGKFLINFPRGPLFIVKQVGLQMSNPQLEHKTNFVTNKPTRGQGLFNNIGNFISNVANKILNTVGPTRIYNLGINTLAQVPVNAFGQHIVRHGFTPRRNDDNLYFKVAQFNNNEANNRLTQLRSILGNVNNISSYIGGPSSIYGLGTTVIQRRGKFIDINRDTTATEWATTGSLKLSSDNAFLKSTGLLVERYLGASNVGSSLLAKIPLIPSSSTNLIVNNTPSPSDKLNPYQVDPAINLKNYLGASNVTSSFLISGSINVPTLDNINQVLVNYPGPSDKLNPYQKDPTINLKNYLRASNISSSLLVSGSIDIPALGIVDQTLVNYPSPSDKLNPYQIDPSTDLKNYLELSNYSSSAYGYNSFNGLNTEIPSTLNEKDPYEYNKDFVKNPHIVTASSDTGLSNYGSDLKDKDININQNVVPNISSLTTLSSKYDAIRKKVSGDSFINQEYDNGNSINPTFTTENVNINRGSDNYQWYVGGDLVYRFNRTNDTDVDDDSLALVFTPLNPFTGNPLSVLSFLGYITEYTENYNSGWSPVKYAGRAEPFYIFNEFTRKLSVGFNIPCFNQSELISKHCDLSELASILAGSYNEDGLMGGIITGLRLGGYIMDQPGIIDTLTFTPIQDSSWDLDKGLAFYIKVNFGFTVIHDFLPQYKECGLRIAPPPEPWIPTDPDPEEPPIEVKPDTRGGGGGSSPTTSSLNLPVNGFNQRMIQDNTRVKSLSERNIFPSLSAAQAAGSSRFSGFGTGNSGGAGAGGTFETPTTTENKLKSRQQAIKKDPKLLLGQNYYNL
jgi:hypothetical protein